MQHLHNTYLSVCRGHLHLLIAAGGLILFLFWNIYCIFSVKLLWFWVLMKRTGLSFTSVIQLATFMVTRYLTNLFFSSKCVTLSMLYAECAVCLLCNGCTCESCDHITNKTWISWGKYFSEDMLKLCPQKRISDNLCMILNFTWQWHLPFFGDLLCFSSISKSGNYCYLLFS
jgi:hypothetical protein